MRRFALPLLAAVVCACQAGAARPVHVAVAGKLTSPVAGSPWTLRLSVRPTSFHGAVRIRATGPKRLDVAATGGRGAYRASLVFPSAGRWTLTALAAGRTTRLGAVRVRAAPARPVPFTEPTSIELEPAGTLLLVENNPGRLLRVNPATGAVTVLVPSLVRPYAVVRAPSGAVFLSVGSELQRLDANGSLVTVAHPESDIGPVAAGANGDVYYATGTQVFRLTGGAGSPAVVGATARFSNPHGLAVAADGALLVSDTGNGEIRRIDLASDTVTAFAQIGAPRGLDVAADGTVYAVDGQANRVVHLGATGTRLGLVGPAFAVPYDVAAADRGVTYLLEAGPVGWVRRIAANGTVTTVSRRSGR